MSELFKGQVEISDLVVRYEALRAEMEQRLGGADAAGDTEQVERLRKEIRAHDEFVTKTLDAIHKRPRPKIGDTQEAVRYAYDDRGDYCDDFYEKGTVVGIDGDKIVISVSEEMIPARVIPARIVTATWCERNHEWVDDASYEYWRDYA